MKQVPTVPFDTARLTYPVLEALERHIRTLPEVTPGNFDEFYDLALRAIAAGGDLHLFSKGILAMNIAGMTRQRAAQISLGVWVKAIGKSEVEQQLKLGITHARWMYANAPCMPNPKAPTPQERQLDAEHKAANGKAYPLVEGLIINGRRTWPGDDPGCKCSSRPIIEGFEDED